LSGNTIGWGNNTVGRGRRRSASYDLRRERIRCEVPVTELLNQFGIPAGQRMKNGHPVYLCPFHDDHSPSLEVSPDDRRWTCWPCNLKMRDTIELAQMILFPQEAERPSSWFDRTLAHIEGLFGFGESEFGTDIRAAASAAAIRARQIDASRSNRLRGRVSNRSNRFRRALSKIVQKAWGSEMAGRAQVVTALYGRLEHLLASGRSAADTEEYNEWRTSVSGWIDDVRDKLGGA